MPFHLKMDLDNYLSLNNPITPCDICDLKSQESSHEEKLFNEDSTVETEEEVKIVKKIKEIILIQEDDLVR